MSGCKKTVITPPNSSYTSLYRNPLTELNRPANGVPLAAHIRLNLGATAADKEHVVGKTKNEGKENEHGGSEPILSEKSKMREDLPKPSFLQLCVKKNEPDSVVGLRNRDCVDPGKQNSLDVWDYSDSEAAPASSWSTLSNRSLLCRPLPLDVGRCTCIIVKESSPDGFDGGTLYTLYTHEGKGRQNRKLAVAHHRRSRGRSEFIIALNARGIMARSDSLIGTVTCNIMGSKYLIWDQGHSSETVEKQPKLLAAMKFMATLSTWTGSYRSIRAWIPKHQSMQLRITNQIQHCNELPTEWEANKDTVHQLFSKAPSYNKYSKKFELDFRDKGRGAGLKIQSSVKNFQLTLERNGKQTILQLGRVDKSKYVMDYRYPLTGYQAFSMCLASIDSKLCCTV